MERRDPGPCWLFLPAVLALFFTLDRVGASSYVDGDECVYVILGRSMLEWGDWLLPWLEGVLELGDQATLVAVEPLPVGYAPGEVVPHVFLAAWLGDEASRAQLLAGIEDLAGSKERVSLAILSRPDGREVYLQPTEKRSCIAALERLQAAATSDEDREAVRSALFSHRFVLWRTW